MNVIVVGGGKVGYYLAETLLEHGHKPFVIETDKEICRKIANNLDIPVINGDGTTLGALESLCQRYRTGSGQSDRLSAGKKTLWCGTHRSPGQQPQEPQGNEASGR